MKNIKADRPLTKQYLTIYASKILNVSLTLSLYLSIVFLRSGYLTLKKNHPQHYPTFEKHSQRLDAMIKRFCQNQKSIFKKEAYQDEYITDMNKSISVFENVFSIPFSALFIGYHIQRCLIIFDTIMTTAPQGGFEEEKKQALEALSQATSFYDKKNHFNLSAIDTSLNLLRKKIWSLSYSQCHISA